MTKQDDKLTTKIFHFYALLEVGLRCLKEEEEDLEEERRSFERFLHGGEGTCEEKTSEKKMRLRDLSK